MLAPEALLLLDRRLAWLREHRPDLQQAIDVQGALVRASLEAPRKPEVSPFPVPREKLAAKIRAGTPVLHAEPATVDVHYSADLFGRLANLVTERGEQDTSALVAAAANGELDPQHLFA